MDRATLIDRYPVLFHMTEDGSWPGIRERGLLSTAALVDLYRPDEATRQLVLDRPRTSSVRLRRSGLPDAVVRDQRPLRLLPDRLHPGTTVRDLLDALNGRVFFWLDEQRLRRLLHAQQYRTRPHLVLRLRTRELVAAHGDAIGLCRLNSGAVNRGSHPSRGPGIFEPIERYATHRVIGAGGRRATPPVELTVPYAVPDVVRHVESVQRWVPGAAEPEPVFAATSETTGWPLPTTIVWSSRVHH